MTTPDIPDAVYEAAAKVLREFRWYRFGLDAMHEADTEWTEHAAGMIARAVWPLAVAAGRAQAAADIERPDSVLCDCGNADYPTNPMTNLPMDHHCDCSAVRAAATMLGAYSATVHARQCGHGTEHDGFYVQAAGGETR